VKCVVRPAARDDILRQYEYYIIYQNASKTAERFLTAVQDAIKQIRKRPGIGSPKALKHPGLTGLRSWPIKGFPSIRVYYLVYADLLRVIRVLQGKRDIDQMWEDDGG
jgi:toxin ParE1/3/4